MSNRPMPEIDVTTRGAGSKRVWLSVRLLRSLHRALSHLGRLCLVGGVSLAGLLWGALASAGSSTPPADQLPSQGKLLVVGGALASSNAPVYRALIDHAQGGPIAIVPVASGKPARYAEQFKRDLIHYGVAESAIRVLPLALVDDPGTGVDESTWARNGFDQSLVQSLADVRHYWFVGGDQTRISQALLDARGQDSPLLAHIRAQLAAGGVVGGTSAGAAMMSQMMIAAGDSISALIQPVSQDYLGMEAQEHGRLHLARGLGFWPGMLVDQHFDRKARLGRLAASLCENTGTPGARLGIGIDEDTAVWVDLARQQFTVLGPGSATLLDGRKIQCRWQQGQREITGLTLSLLSAGDQFDVNSFSLKPAAGKQATLGAEAFAGGKHAGGGMAMGNQRLDHLLGFELLDNASNTVIERWSLVPSKDGVRGIAFRFTEHPLSQGYWGYLDGTKDSYSAHNVRFDILPLALPDTHAVSQPQTAQGIHP